ncbi:MAG: DUF2846 domain-containing protein [Terriglobales bacterium]
MKKATLVVLPVAVVLMFASLAFAQDEQSPGCGDPNTKFAVKTTKSQHSGHLNGAQPDSGKALVYFVEDDTGFESRPKPTTRIGVDGQRVGATHGNSYLFFSVDPGVHHLCASWQTAIALFLGRQTAAAHFTAEAGRTYFFSAKNIWILNGPTDMSLNPMDSDEGELLANKFSFSTSHPK